MLFRCLRIIVLYALFVSKYRFGRLVVCIFISYYNCVSPRGGGGMVFQEKRIVVSMFGATNIFPASTDCLLFSWCERGFVGHDGFGCNCIFNTLHSICLVRYYCGGMVAN